MLAGKYRFHGHGALKYLFGHGKTYKFRQFSIRTVENKRREDSRVSVVVSKKVVKAAPKRNQIRRRVYEVVRVNWCSIKPSSDMLISVYDRGVLELSPQQLQEDVKQLLTKAGLWVDHN